MDGSAFVDYYDALQLSQNATAETIQQVHRLLAKRYHPDNQSTGSAEKFTELQEAYDVKYDEKRSRLWSIFDQDSAQDGREEDQRIIHGILSLLYVSRRRDVRNPGMGPVHLEKIRGCPQEHMGFRIWYLKQKGWIETLPNGQLALTVDGVDKLGDEDLALREDRLLPESSLADMETSDSEGEKTLVSEVPAGVNGDA